MKYVKATHLALYLPGFGYSGQVTACHHHGPGGARQTGERRWQPATDADHLQSSAAAFFNPQKYILK